jgi:hypothetical protein
MDYLRALLPRIPANQCGHFFGSDIHNIRYQVSNHVSIPADGPLTEEHVIQQLRQNRHTSRSRLTGISLSASLPAGELGTWLEEAATKRPVRSLAAQGVSSVLKAVYHALPRPVRKRINGFKNTVKSKL